jgi:hypothetical protein
MFSSASAITICVPEAAIGRIFGGVTVSKRFVPDRIVPARAIVLVQAIVLEIASAPAIVAATVRAHAIVPAATEPIGRIDPQAGKAREEIAPHPPTARAVAREQTAAAATRRSGTYPPAGQPISRQPAADRVLPAREFRARVRVLAVAAFAAAEVEAEVSAVVVAAAAPTLR